MTLLHDKKYFYKYVTAKTALLILQSCTLKYSSPVTFNDPFDTQTRLDFDFEMSEFMEPLADELYRLIYDEDEPVGDGTSLLFRYVLAARQMAKNSSKKVPRDVFNQRIKTVLEDSIERGIQYIEYMNSWWRQVVRVSRVFCVAEEYDNLLMWAHYTRDHTGAVIQFECLPELDTMLCAVREVKYEVTPPKIAKLDEYLQHLTGQDTSKIKHNELLFKFFLSKSKHWIYEHEWRVFIPPADMENPAIPKDDNGEDILFDLKPFHPQEIHSIYLGCKMSDDDRQKVEKCLTGDFGHVKMYNCIRSEKEYKLDFEEMVQ